MSQAVHPRKTRTDSLALVDPELLPVIEVARDQRTFAGQPVGAVQHGPLHGSARRMQPG